MGKLRPFVRKDSYMPNKKWIPFVIGNGYTTTDGASGPAPEYETVTGNPVSFNAITPFPLKQLSVAFSPVQSLNGYDAPWPAGGGKNKFDIDHPFYTAPENSVLTNHCAKVEDGKLYNGGSIGITTGASITIPVVAGQTYTLSFTINGEDANWEVRAVTLNGQIWASNTIVARSTGSASTGAKTATFEVPSGYTHVFVSCYSATKYGSWETDIQLELGSSASAWTPYSNECPISGWSSLTVYHSGADTSNPQTISISLGSTVYSGYVDVISGVGEVTMASVDLGTLDWLLSGNIFYALVGDVKPPSTGTQVGNIMCSIYKAVSRSAMANSGEISLSTNKYINVIDSAYTDVATFKTAMNGVQLVYELATPIPISLTPQEVQSLLGENVMWSDANGDLTVEYRSN